MIREAKPADAPAIFALSTELHAASRYRHIPYCEIKVKRLIAFTVGAPSQFCWVSERDGEIAGVLMAVADEIVWSRKKEAHDLWFHVRPEARGDGAFLARRFVRWAKNRGVVLYGLSVSSGVDDERSERLFRALGMEKQVSVYARFLEG